MGTLERLKTIGRALAGPLYSSIRTRRHLRQIDRNKSRMLDRRYRDYHSLAMNNYSVSNNGFRFPDSVGLAESFQRKGFAHFHTPDSREASERVFATIQEEEKTGATIWDAETGRYLDDIGKRFPELVDMFKGSVGEFIEATFKSHFKIYYGVIYRSLHLKDQKPEGSQLWHADGGPGTCMNVLVYLKDVTAIDGAMECLPWRESLQVFSEEFSLMQTEEGVNSGVVPRDAYREALCNFYASQISEKHSQKVVQPTGPAGTVLGFRNNIIHKGGFPFEEGRTRYVAVFHVYPSHVPVDLDKYKRIGLAKKGPYPEDPSADF